MTWPPRDTDRNRFLGRLQVVVYGLVTVYFGVFAVASGGLLPWAIFTVALAATVVVAVALMMMRAERRARTSGDPVTPAASPGSPAPR